MDAARFPDRPASPVRGVVQPTGPAKVAAYRPPGAMGRSSTIKVHDDEVPPDAPPDAPTLSKAALKNKKKREARAKAQANGGPVEDDDDGEEKETIPVAPQAISYASTKLVVGSLARERAQERIDAVAMTKLILTDSSPVPLAATTGGVTEDPEKRIRNLNKKLRQIEELKALRSKGEFLQANQLEKLAAEASVLGEIEALTKVIASSSSISR